MEKLWEKFPILCEMVRRDHRQKGVAVGGPHDFTHALMVAQYAFIIAKDTAVKRIGELAWIAGICHNTDRLFPVSDDQIAEKVREYLTGTDLDDFIDQEQVVEAVLKHSRPNETNDNTITIALKDADRLANIGPNWYLRMAQYAPRLPVCDPRYFDTADPEATYRNCRTLFHQFRCVLEWEGWLRMPKAKEMAKPWFDAMRQFMAGLEDQLKEVRLVPYPFEDDFDHAYAQQRRGE